jgi:hypothetical protein
MWGFFCFQAAVFIDITNCFVCASAAIINALSCLILIVCFVSLQSVYQIGIDVIDLFHN